MADFNTHGGYFSPKDYTRVNEGGSHEENPYGGVQIGVDPEGNPNLLEEGEPVYKDYVYSDNITAEAEFLEQNHLPIRYAGKLYSKIADDLFEEAEERPMDPISRNGLEAMLGRLAEAQESQKQRDQQKALEEELAQLSPEELDALEAMLAEGEQPEAVEPAPMQMPGEMPMMACGGFIRKYDAGGPIEDNLDDFVKEAVERNRKQAEYERAKTDLRIAQNALQRRNFWSKVVGVDTDSRAKSIETQEKNLVDLATRFAENKGGIYSDPNSPYLSAMMTALDSSKNKLKKSREKKEKYDAKTAKLLENVADKRATLLKSGEGLYQSSLPGAKPLDSVSDTTDLMFDDEPTVLDIPRDTTKKIIGTNWGMDDIDWSDYDENSFARGGKVNIYPDGGWADFMKRLADYRYSLNPANVAGKYAIDRRGNVWGGRTAREIEADQAYKDFTNYVLSNSGNDDVRAYLRALDNGVAKGTPLLFNGDELVSGWEDLFRHRREDGNLGIYHINPEDTGFLTVPAASAVPAQNPQPAPAAYTLDGLRSGMMYDWMRDNPTGLAYRPKQQETPTLYPGYDLTWNGIAAKDGTTLAPVAAAGETETDVRQLPEYHTLPTWPRYAGAVGAGLLGLYDVFTPADKYTQQRLNPQTPEGRVHMQNEVYNPVDQNMVANSILAQGNATTRALRNSGLGPSTAAAVLASDNNTANNLGTGFIQTWDANNQRRNQVIAANNAAEAQRANFDYAVDQQKKAILNEAAYRNAYNDLMLQRLNYGAEGDKYQAISNQIGIGLKALSDIGAENFAMNQVNTNPAYLGYRVAPNGTMRYMPWYAGCGGFIKKYKK